MAYNKTYLLAHSFRSLNLTQREIADKLNISKSTVNRLLTNKQKEVKESTNKKVLKSIKKQSYYNRKSKSHSNDWKDVKIIFDALVVSKHLDQINNSYNVMRRSKKLKKENEPIELIEIKINNKAKRQSEKFDYYDLLQAGLIEIIGSNNE